MHELIEARRGEIEALCRTLRIGRLDLFGSAVGTRSTPRPVMSTCWSMSVAGPGFDYFGTYFELKEGSERILGRPVDLVSAARIRNPFFKQRVLRTRDFCMRRDARAYLWDVLPGGGHAE